VSFSHHVFFFMFHVDASSAGIYHFVTNVSGGIHLSALLSVLA